MNWRAHFSRPMWAGLLAAALVGGGILSALAQNKSLNARIKDFQAPASDDSGRKSFLKGKDASHVGDGVFQITAPHVETYKPDGSLDITIDAANCFFDKDKTKEVWSETSLAMKTGDGRLALQGVGFRWNPSKSLLTISNQVQATIHRDAVAQSANVAASVLAPARTNESTVRVTADRLEYTPESIQFRGHVFVDDPQGQVRCETLHVSFTAGNQLNRIEAIDDVILTQGTTEARGKRAIYTPSSGLLRLSEGTTWKMKDGKGASGEGSSELLILDRTNSTLRAETKVTMILPVSLLATNTEKKSTIRISADTFDYAQTNAVTRGPIAIFNGNVRAVDPQANLDCELLTIFFNATNRLARAVADRDVSIRHENGEIRGPRAVFENEEITVTDPTWRSEEKFGSSKTLAFNPKTREIRALQNVRMQMPSSSTNFIFGAQTNSTSASAGGSGKAEGLQTNFVLITAEAFTNANNTATFSRNVRVNEPRGQIDANFLTLTYNQSNRVQRIVADGDVILTQAKMQAIGQKADYDLQSEQIRLTGTPKIFTEGRSIIAREFQIDRLANKFKPLAPFRIEIDRGTNTSGMPKL